MKGLCFVPTEAGVDPFAKSLPNAGFGQIAAAYNSPVSKMITRRFQVALSFPGEVREFIGTVADELAAVLGRERVLYDDFLIAELARPDLDVYLGVLYRDESDLLVPFYSADYERKKWCRLEWRQMRDILLNFEGSRIMPFRFDGTPIPGVLSVDGYVSIGERSPQQVASLILERLGTSNVATADQRGAVPALRRTSSPAKVTSKVTILLPDDYATFSEEKQRLLQRLLAAAVELDEDQIEILRTRPAGSMEVDIRIPADAVRKLLEEFATGQGPLADRGIERVEAEERTTVVSLRHLPTAPWALVGREAELAELDRIADDENIRIVTIVAFGGVGKTSLVAAWVSRLASAGWRNFRRVFAWSFYREGSSDVFLHAALAFFGDAELVATAADGWTKGERLAQLIAQYRTLLILDGLEPLQDARTGELRDPALTSLLRGLVARGHGLCLVTTRQVIPDLDAFRSAATPQWKLAHLSKEAGANLLENLGVRGTVAERETLASDVKGHALTLTLLGKFLAEAYGGDIRRRDLVSLSEADFEETSGHAFRLMEAYEQWLQRDGREVELAILRILGAFDRPATPDCLRALRKAPAIDGLTNALVALTDAQWNLAVKRLVGLGLIEEQPWEPPRVAGYSEEEARKIQAERTQPGDMPPPQVADERLTAGNVLDTHPLIRQHFARRLRDTSPEAWRVAHGRLYEYLRNSVPYWPEGVDVLQPLYEAIVHGCLAGRFVETRKEVYRDRILRGTSGPHAFYSSTILGLTSANLAAVRCFFTVPWKQLAADFTSTDQSWLLGEAAFYLRALGRLEEAREPMRAGLETRIALEDWENAAVRAGNLSEFDLSLGNVASAVRHSEQSVQYADRSGYVFSIINMRTAHADALHQAGRAQEAGERFREAEALQREHVPITPLLYSLQGFQFCDLLLAGVERAAWRRCLGTDAQPFDADTLSDVEHRSTIALAIAMRKKWVRDTALDKLTLGRVALFREILGNASIDDAPMRVEAAVKGLRQAGQVDDLPRALLTRAWLRVLHGDEAAARADLDEVQMFAERGPMRLYLADVHLYRARLFFRENLDAAREELKKARALIERCSYHRRDDEVRDAENVIS
ncbi:MAG TPA: hypothetical protein VNI54_11545 [Thermoanaerobaculia bacterium]|nr:hypothetical protein [Thermoanaerobaculia bacterium]